MSAEQALTWTVCRRLALTRAGLLRRNNMVYGQALAAGVPLVIVMGGGCASAFCNNAWRLGSTAASFYGLVVGCSPLTDLCRKRLGPQHSPSSPSSYYTGSPLKSSTFTRSAKAVYQPSQRLWILLIGHARRPRVLHPHTTVAHQRCTVRRYSRPMDDSIDAHTDVYRTAAYRVAAAHKGEPVQS